MSELFEVSTDYLIKGEETSKSNETVQQSVHVPRKLYFIAINIQSIVRIVFVIY